MGTVLEKIGPLPRLGLVALLLLGFTPMGTAQDRESLIVRTPPPPLEDFETDQDDDGVPDGWYNLRNATLAEGGVVGPTLLRFENDEPSRPARISRGFGLDGRKTEALIVGLWVRQRDVLPGERIGEEPMLMIDMLGDDLESTARPMIGPWTQALGESWVRVAKRVPVPPATRDAIMTVGLLGATGTLEIDGLSIEEVPVGGRSTTNLIVNGDFELGARRPAHWIIEGPARRSHPGRDSETALELTRAGSKALASVGVSVKPVSRLAISVSVRGSGLRGSGGARAGVFFLDDLGRPLQGAAGAALAFQWSGAFPWRTEQTTVRVPPNAARAVLQFEKIDALGTLHIDNVHVAADAAPTVGGLLSWTPYRVEPARTNWFPFEAVEAIEPESALDASAWLDAPAGAHGFVTVEDGRLVFEDGTPARFFGVCLMPPVAFQPPERAHLLAERLARSGVNLVRFGDLDAPLGPSTTLIDDARDDTMTLDPFALENFDSLIAALKQRGIYVAIELQAQTRFRANDDIAGYRQLPPAGGPAAAYDPAIRQRAETLAELLFNHVNPETGLALKDDPVLAWVTLSGEASLFNLIERPDLLPKEQAELLRSQLRASRASSGRRGWQALEGRQWTALADHLRELGVRVPIAGCSHWRREPEFVAAQTVNGLDLIDDRVFWGPPPFAAPEFRSLLRYPRNTLVAEADRKRREGIPYVLGEFAEQTEGAWALPFEGADLILASGLAALEGWDAFVRWGIALSPERWGQAATGTGGGKDVYLAPEALNGIPQAFSLLPHAASIYRHATDSDRAERGQGRGPMEWNHQTGRLVVDTPYTQGLAGWAADRAANFSRLSIGFQNPFAVVLISSADEKPIAESDRLLVTAIAQVAPTGLRYVDEWRREVADPGRSPLLVEPVQAEILWKREGTISAYALDNAGRRGQQIPVRRTTDSMRIDLDGSSSNVVQYELVVESP